KYRMNAYNGGGSSAWSNLASAMTPSRTPDRLPGHYPVADEPEFLDPTLSKLTTNDIASTDSALELQPVQAASPAAAATDYPFQKSTLGISLFRRQDNAARTPADSSWDLLNSLLAESREI